MARAAGTFVQLVGRDQGRALLRMASGEVRMVQSECMATIGAVSNPDNQNGVLGKAGRSRWLGIRPSIGSMLTRRKLPLQRMSRSNVESKSSNSCFESDSPTKANGRER